MSDEIITTTNDEVTTPVAEETTCESCATTETTPVAEVATDDAPVAEEAPVAA